jgi:hypothetical protein
VLGEQPISISDLRAAHEHFLPAWMAAPALAESALAE